MRTISTWGVVAAAAAMTLAPLAPATAASGPAVKVIQGSWVSGTASDCSIVPATGRYSMTLKRDGTATVSLTMFRDGALHAAWGGNVFGKFTWTEDAGLVTVTQGWLEFVVGPETVTFTIPGLYDCGDGKVTGTVR